MRSSRRSSEVSGGDTMAAASATAGSSPTGEKCSEDSSVEPPCKRPNQSDEDNLNATSSSTEHVLVTGESGDTAEEMDDTDQEGFKVVSHRKKRTVGIPVLLSPVQPGKDLRRENPIALFSAVSALLGKSPNRSRFTTQGALLLDVTTEEEVNALLRCGHLGGVAVSARLPHSYVQNTCVIKGVPKWHTEEELLTYLKPQGVLHVRRIVRRDRSSPDKWKVLPTNAVVLTFAPNSERPEKINLGFTRHEVTEYTESPPRCFKCQRYGHIAKVCRGEQRCKRCGGSHDFVDCKEKVSCANCGGGHPASYSGCPFRVSALHRRKAFISGPEPPPEPAGAPQTSDNQQFPALPPLDPATARVSERESTSSALPTSPVPHREAESAQEPPQAVETKQRRDAHYSQVLKKRSDRQEEPKSGNLVEILRSLFAALRSYLVTMAPGTTKTILHTVLSLEPVILGSLVPFLPQHYGVCTQ